MKIIVIQPGGYHPVTPGHIALYQLAKKTWPNADVYMAATNDTSNRPFPFAIKEKLAKLAGVEDGHFVQVKSPFRAQEITQKITDPDNTALIFVRSEKDRNTSPQPGGIKKDGSPSYLQPLSDNIENITKHAYMAYLPTVEFADELTSATEIRTRWPTMDNAAKSVLVNLLYPRIAGNKKLTVNVVKMLDAVIGGASEVDVNEAVLVNDPEKGILIRPSGGMGTWNEEMLVSSLAAQLTDIVQFLKAQDYHNVEYVLYTAGPIKAKIQALARLQEFREKQGKRPIARGREIDIGENRIDYVEENIITTLKNNH